MKINISKALKTKNRLVEKLSKLQNDLTKYNSVLEEVSIPIDLKNTWDQIGILQDKIVNIKSEISIANIPIQKKIYQMAEIKGMIALLSKLNTNNGKVEKEINWRSENPETYQIYKAYLTKPQVDEIITGLQTTIDELQDEIDSFNAITIIEVNI